MSAGKRSRTDSPPAPISHLRDRHDPVSPVETLLPIFSIRLTISPVHPSESVTVSHWPYFKIQSYQTFFSEDRGQHARTAAGLSPVRNPVPQIYPDILRMSASSEGDGSKSFDENLDENSGSVASSLASDVQGRLKRQRPAQIREKAWDPPWVSNGEITTPLYCDN